MSTTIEAARAEALFVSAIQPSDDPAPDDVRATVSEVLRCLGTRACACQVAREFGEHPDTAPARMRWALSAVRATYPIVRATGRALLGTPAGEAPAYGSVSRLSGARATSARAAGHLRAA
jgi:hypothetical protein